MDLYSLLENKEYEFQDREGVFFLKQLLNHKDFRNAYRTYLDRFTHQDYVNDLISEYADELKQLEKELRLEGQKQSYRNVRHRSTTNAPHLLVSAHRDLIQGRHGFLHQLVLVVQSRLQNFDRQRT